MTVAALQFSEISGPERSRGGSAARPASATPTSVAPSQASPEELDGV